MTARRSMMLALVFLLGAAPLVTAANDVPFHADIDTQPSIAGFCGPNCIVLEIPGSGTATHMGALEVSGPSQVDVAAGTQTATSTFVAANGDKLVIDIEGTVQFSGGPTDPVTFSGTWQVVSGTGRFEGATGGGSYFGSAAIPVGGVLTLDGSISRPGRR